MNETIRDVHAAQSGSTAIAPPTVGSEPSPSFVDVAEVRPLVTCYCDTDPVHSSYPVTGLIELAEAGEIELRFRGRDRSLPRSRGFWALWLRVEAEGEDSGVAVDCHDLDHYFCPHALGACRFYYKSNLGQGTYERAPKDLQSRLRPLGPYLPSRPAQDRDLFRRWLGNLRVKFDHRFFVSNKSGSLGQKWRTFRPEFNRIKRYRSRKVWSQYESPPADEPRDAPLPADAPAVFFNPSCWDEISDPSVAQINDVRSRLICGLREALGPRFVGGFRRYGPVWQRYPAAAEDRTISHDEYVRLVKSALVTVYVNGLGNCYSWRLAEVMAASQCIVTEPIVNDAGFPFDESTGFVMRPTPEEMVKAVVELIQQPARVRELRRHAWRAYCEQVRPPVRMRRILADVIQAARGSRE